MPAAASLTAQNADLRKMRRIATGVLGGLAAIFVGTHFIAEPGGPVLLLRAMAEAGMVGGLADWFAVEALFRRPLGLPIPHTALLPSNQDRAAKNVGEFFDTYFMDPAQLRGKLEEINLAARLSDWLAERDNAGFITRQITDLLAAVFKSGIGAELTPKSAAFLQKGILEAVNSAAMSREVSALLKDTLHGEILDAVLERVRVAIDQNRDMVVKLVQERSRWWIASTVDRRIAGLLVDGVISVVQELGTEESELRRDFEASVAALIDGFERDGFLARQIDAGKTKFVNSAAFRDLSAALIGTIQDRIANRLETDPEGFAGLLAEPVQAFARRLHQDAALRAEFNVALLDGMEHVLARLRPALAAYVSDTIAGWDSADLIDRFENAVGRDLQFIRINGAVLGSLIGGTLFLFGILFV